MTKKFLVADIGGTNSRFALFESSSNTLVLLSDVKIATESVSSFAELLSAVANSELSLKPSEADFCVFAVAGAIREDALCQPPNIKWEIDLRKAAADFKIREFALINDFVAQALACLSPVVESAIQIQEGVFQQSDVIAVVGAGTGLGKCALMFDNAGRFHLLPSEGGHASVSVETEREFDFLRFLKNHNSSKDVCWDDVVSGRGLSAIHLFLKNENLKPAEVARTFDDNSKTLEWFARFYGRVCRNYVLDVLALKGLYIAGGVAAKNPVIIKHRAFRESFLASDNYRDMLAGVPIFLLDNQNSGLWGAAYYANAIISQEVALPQKLSD